MIQPIDKNDFYNYQLIKSSTMIDNYIYLYHTDTLIAIPTVPDSLTDVMAVNYQSTEPLSRSAPIYSFANSGPRSFSVDLNFHRDMINQINTSSSNLNIPDLDSEDYADILIKQLYACAVPRYAASEKMVDPPIVAVRFANDIFCKGVITGQVTHTYSGPILRNNKYAEVTVSFAINEIDPYDANSVMVSGGFRGLSTDLERRIWKRG